MAVLKVYQVSILTRAEARVRRAEVSEKFHRRKFQSSLGPKPECDGPILAHVLDGAQGAICANPPKRTRGRWGVRVKRNRVFKLP